MPWPTSLAARRRARRAAARARRVPQRSRRCRRRAARSAAATGPAAAAFLRIPAVSRRGDLARRQAHRGARRRTRASRWCSRSPRVGARRSNYLTKIAPRHVDPRVRLVGERRAGRGLRAAGRERASATLQQSRSVDGRSRLRRRVRRSRRATRARVPDGRAARGTWRQRSRDTSWPLEVHPSLPGARDPLACPTTRSTC